MAWGGETQERKALVGGGGSAPLPRPWGTHAASLLDPSVCSPLGWHLKRA